MQFEANERPRKTVFNVCIQRYKRLLVTTQIYIYLFYIYFSLFSPILLLLSPSAAANSFHLTTVVDVSWGRQDSIITRSSQGGTTTRLLLSLELKPIKVVKKTIISHFLDYPKINQKYFKGEIIANYPTPNLNVTHLI